MHPLSAHDILLIWEQGQVQHPVGRALTMLAAACPEANPDDLAAFSIGQRDAHLLTLRELTFGTRFNGFAMCPECNNRIEFTMSAADMRVTGASCCTEQVHKISVNGLDLRFRLPNSQDLAAVINCSDVATTCSLLIQRCVLQASRNSAVISPDELSEDITARLAAYMAEYDPQAEVLLNLKCPECHHTWQIIFDIVSFFWAEISTNAKRLLREVHTLAMAYGWRESDILSMSTARRQFYLEMVNCV